MRKLDVRPHHVINEMGILPQFEGIPCQAKHNAEFHVTISEERVEENGHTLFQRFVMWTRFVARKRDT